MNMNLQWVSTSDTVAGAARIMRDRSMGFLLVREDESGKLAGVVTDRDLAIRCCAADQRPDQIKIADVASKEVVTCGRDESIKVAERKMIESEKSRLVIVDDADKPVGVLSLTDILRGDRAGRAVKTARRILAREADGAHEPIESIKLTPSTTEEENRAARHHSPLHGGSWDTTVKMFP
jgi:signal-transduction protein with cAMP-binding, CBS, and nucleotidyltransferase domain